MAIKVFFRPEMVADSGSFSPGSSKAEPVIVEWLAQELPVQIITAFHPASRNDLCAVHLDSYVDGILSGAIENGHGNRSLDLAESFRWTCGSMVAAAISAVEDGIACSPTSGFHHACYSRAMAYCTFNGLVLAAVHLLNRDLARTVAILDCDWHFGNGTAEIVRRLNIVNQVTCYSTGEHAIPNVTAYMRILKRWLADLEADAVLYQAGADASARDPLGGLLSDDELRERDSFVFETLKRRGIPVAFNFAGGYERDNEGTLTPVIERHTATTYECCKAWRLL